MKWLRRTVYAAALWIAAEVALEFWEVQLHTHKDDDGILQLGFSWTPHRPHTVLFWSNMNEGFMMHHYEPNQSVERFALPPNYMVVR